jgi:hypothetical protein
MFSFISLTILLIVLLNLEIEISSSLLCIISLLCDYLLLWSHFLLYFHISKSLFWDLLTCSQVVGWGVLVT